MIESFNHHLYVNILGHIFALEEVKISRDHSDEFDMETKTKQRKIYIPPLSHPWKHVLSKLIWQNKSIDLRIGANVSLFFETFSFLINAKA